jgi:arylsulfatase A-like enzyme
MLAGSLGAAGLMLTEDLRAQRKAAPPNIIYIMADDLGYADVGCYGRPELKTPNIDSLARKGTRFTQAYANSAVCSATRLALITGRYQYRLRLGLEEPLAASQDIGLPPEHPTLPSLLRQAGYGTTLIGKWHLGALPKFSPTLSGYDHFYGFRSGAVDYYTHKSSADRDDFWDDNVPVSKSGYMTTLLGDRAVEVVSAYARARQPFYVSLHFNAPHWPWEVPGDDRDSKRVAGTLLRDYDGGSLATYHKMIAEMDMQIGRVLKALRSAGVADNTIVIFTSDNGGERFSDVWPFTGRKTELLEGGLRIPSIISWPGKIAANKVTEQVAISMDWVPTLLAAAGAQPDPAYPLDGVNLLPVLTQQGPLLPRKLYWRYKSNHQRAMRDGDYKFLKILDNTFLFNVVEDPLERANLKGRHKEVFERMQADWLQWNRGMLPELAESFTDGHTGADFADHIGTPPASPQPDNPAYD